MPKLKPKLPLASAVGESTFELNHDDWERIERAYRHKLSDNARRKFFEATQSFIEWEELERSAEPSLAAETRIVRYRRAATTFLRNLRVPSKGEGDDARTYADYLVEKHFECSPLSGSRKLDTLPIVATSLIVACEIALDELASELSGYQSGDGWNEWIRRLTAIAKRHSLPRGARTDNSDRPSDFVELVRALQNHVPIAARRGRHSGQALAQLINRARGEVKISDSADEKAKQRRQRARAANRAKQDAANNAATIAEDKREVQSLLDQIGFLTKRHKDEAGDFAKQNLVEITASIKNGTAKLTLQEQINHLTRQRDALLAGQPEALGAELSRNLGDG